MTLLSVIQDVALDFSFPKPNGIVLSTDPTIKQLLSFARVTARKLNRDFEWQVQLREATITTIAAENQGVLTTLVTDYDRMISESMFNRTQQRPVDGPRSPVSHQGDLAMSSTRLRDSYRLRGGSLFILPAPAAGETIAFEYITNQWASSAAGAGQTDFLADTDTFPIGEDLLRLGIAYRFLDRKGFAFETEQAEYLAAVDAAFGNDRVQGRLTQDASADRRRSRVAEGSWNL